MKKIYISVWETAEDSPTLHACETKERAYKLGLSDILYRLTHDIDLDTITWYPLDPEELDETVLYFQDLYNLGQYSQAVSVWQEMDFEDQYFRVEEIEIE